MMYVLYIHIHPKNFHKLMNIYYLVHDIPKRHTIRKKRDFNKKKQT